MEKGYTEYPIRQILGSNFGIRILYEKEDNASGSICIYDDEANRLRDLPTIQSNIIYSNDKHCVCFEIMHGLFGDKMEFKNAYIKRQ